MLIVTINEIPGKKLEALGVVRGSTVSRSRNRPAASEANTYSRTGSSSPVRGFSSGT